MAELMDQALLLQLKQRPRENVSSRLAQYLLQQAGRQGPVYGTVGVLAAAAQPMLAAWLAKQGEEREREAEREAFNKIVDLEKQRAQEAEAFWRGITPQQMPETQRLPMSQRSEIIRETLPEPIEASYERMFDRLAQDESGGNPNARNQRSSATGLFQFTDDTWREFARANPRRFEGMTDEQILAARTDPALSREAAEWYARRNALILGTAGLQPTPTNLALAHRFGGQGAIAILKADPSALVTDVVPDGQRVLEANPNLRGITAGQIIERYRQLVGDPQPQIQASAQAGAQLQAQASPVVPTTPDIQPAPMPNIIPAAQGVLPAGVNSAPMPNSIPSAQGVLPSSVTPAPTPQTIPAAQGIIPATTQPRQMPEAIPGLPQGATPEIMARALAHPNPVIRQQAEAYLKAAQMFQRQTPNLTSVAPGSFLVDPRTGQVIGQVPDRPNVTSVAPGSFLVDPRTGQVTGQVPQLPSERERLLSQFIAFEIQRGTPPEQAVQKAADALDQWLRGGRSRENTPRNEGPIPAGMRAKRDEHGNIVALESIPGGPVEEKRIEREERQRLQEEQKKAEYSIVDNDIQRALKMLNNRAFRFAEYFEIPIRWLPDIATANLQGLLSTISGNVAFDKLNEMRKASPTGGALGNVTERELDLLKDVKGSLSLNQTPAQLRENLERIRKELERVVHGPNARAATPQSTQLPAQQENTPSLPGGLPPLPPDLQRRGVRIINNPAGQQPSNTQTR